MVRHERSVGKLSRQGVADTGIAGHAAYEGDGMLEAEASSESDDLARDGHAEPGCDAVARMAEGDQTDDFALGEDCAGAGNRKGLGRGSSGVAEVVEGHVEGAGHDLEETASPRGAAIVEGEVDGVAELVGADDLAVLPADIDDRADVGKEVMDAASLAGDLGRAGGSLGKEIAAVAGNAKAGEIGRSEVPGVQGRGEGGIGGFTRSPAGRNDGTSSQPLNGIPHDRFGRDGAEVKAGHKGRRARRSC